MADEHEEAEALNAANQEQDQQALRVQQYDDYYYNQAAFFTTEKINLPRGKVVKEDSLKSSPSHGFRQMQSAGGFMSSTAMKARGSLLPAGSVNRSPSPMHINMNKDREADKLRSFSISRNLKHCAGNSLKPGDISPNKIGKKYQQQIEGTDRPPAYQEGVDYYKEFWRLFLQNENLINDIDQIATSNYKCARKIFNIKDFYENTLVPQILTQPHKFLHRLRQ